mmetsp:Transcript_25046/g.42568  ORF Transcript_25046/g.42568 Transcript_25046/m.42568 type:complete len:200 (+) Transcript_25046:526-1125(+)
MPSGPILITLLVMKGSSGVPLPETVLLSESAESPNKSASTSPKPFSESSPVLLSPPPNKSFRLIIFPKALSSLDVDFFGSSFGKGIPNTAFASSPSSDCGIEGDFAGRFDVLPSLFTLRRVMPCFDVPLDAPFASFPSSYNIIPGSAFIASRAAAVSGCQEACLCTIFHLPPIFLKIFVVTSLLTNARSRSLSPEDPLA